MRSRGTREVGGGEIVSDRDCGAGEARFFFDASERDRALARAPAGPRDDPEYRTPRRRRARDAAATSTVAVARRRRIHRRDYRARAFARDADSARARTPRRLAAPERERTKSRSRPIVATRRLPARSRGENAPRERRRCVRVAIVPTRARRARTRRRDRVATAPRRARGRPGKPDMIAIAENVNQSSTFCWTRTTSTGAAALATIAQRRDARVVRAAERAGSAILQVWVRAAMVPGASEWGPGRDRERENPPDETNVVPSPKSCHTGRRRPITSRHRSVVSARRAFFFRPRRDEKSKRLRSRFSLPVVPPATRAANERARRHPHAGEAHRASVTYRGKKTLFSRALAKRRRAPAEADGRTISRRSIRSFARSFAKPHRRWRTRRGTRRRRTSSP